MLFSCYSPLISTILIILSACSPQSTDQTATNTVGAAASHIESNVIYASTYFLKSMVEEILLHPTDYRVELIFTPKQDTASSTIDQKRRSQLQAARLVILNGAHLESGLAMVNLPLSRTIKTARTLNNDWLNYPDDFQTKAHRHGPSGVHQHRGVDGHTWMSPRLLKRQLNVLAEGMKSRGVPYQQARLDQCRQSLDKIWNEWQSIRSLLSKRVLVSNHPAYQYLIRDLGIEMRAFDIDPSVAASQEALKMLSSYLDEVNDRSKAKSTSPPMMWWESEPSVQAKSSLRTLGLQHVVVSSLEKDPSPYISIIDALSAQLDTVKGALKLDFP